MEKIMNNYEEIQQEMLKKVQTCQKDHDLKTCFDCDKLLDCELRDEYVKATYEYLSEGKQGDFDF